MLEALSLTFFFHLHSLLMPMPVLCVNKIAGKLLTLRDLAAKSVHPNKESSDRWFTNTHVAMVRILAAMFNDMEERHVTSAGQVRRSNFFACSCFCFCFCCVGGGGGGGGDGGGGGVGVGVGGYVGVGGVLCEVAVDGGLVIVVVVVSASVAGVVMVVLVWWC